MTTNSSSTFSAMIKTARAFENELSVAMLESDVSEVIMVLDRFKAEIIPSATTFEHTKCIQGPVGQLMLSAYPYLATDEVRDAARRVFDLWKDYWNFPVLDDVPSTTTESETYIANFQDDKISPVQQNLPDNPSEEPSSDESINKTKRKKTISDVISTEGKENKRPRMDDETTVEIHEKVMTSPSQSNGEDGEEEMEVVNTTEVAGLERIDIQQEVQTETPKELINDTSSEGTNATEVRGLERIEIQQEVQTEMPKELVNDTSSERTTNEDREDFWNSDDEVVINWEPTKELHTLIHKKMNKIEKKTAKTFSKVVNLVPDTHRIKLAKEMKIRLKKDWDIVRDQIEKDFSKYY